MKPQTMLAPKAAMLIATTAAKPGSPLRSTLECFEQGVTLSELDTAASLKIRLLATFLFFLCSSVVPNIQSAAVVLIL